ncbi:ECF-type sigma factor [Aeoliella sp. ICT_H6.2]|uniref:ECF-type sigma factor n=1 Tax=Aeoliella straminimaris TaxID=2954799 RepID=A0A9X2JIK1_9BACT|nr:ECF-type sigma factor [Aeoliella straminimaris]MCO6046647.1 ECF-type sigma factor [Aeoliella straminimaris]
MTDVTQILSQVEQGDPSAAEQLLPLVYSELRKLAAAKLAHEKPGQTLQATALVHEAYVKLVNVEHVQQWDSRAHFFAAAAEAMRRILIESVRRKNSVKHGGGHHRVELKDVDLPLITRSDDLIALDQALDELEIQQPETAKLVKLRYFAGFSNAEASEILGISPRHANTLWAFAKAWLHERVFGDNRS